MLLEISEEHLQIIDAALMELPYKIARPVYDALNRQIETCRAVENNVPVDAGVS